MIATRFSTGTVRRTLVRAACAAALAFCAALPHALAAPPQSDPDPWEEAGLRKLRGEHLTLYTDAPASPEVGALPRVFDLAVAQWAKALDAPERWRTYRATAFLIVSKERFRSLGQPPQDLPPFANGYQRAGRIWLYEQPSAYYRRHLLLHEGVHGFMEFVFGGLGPPWYSEGVAEFLATHSWDGARLEVAVTPRDKLAAPHWGRIKIIRDAFARQRARELPAIFRYPPQAHLQVEPYGWCWAAVMMLTAAS